MPDYRWFQIVNVQKRPVPGGLGFKIVVTVGFRCRAAPAAASQMQYIVNQSAIFSLKTWSSAKRKLENEAYLSPKQLSEEKLPWGEFNEIYRRRKRPGFNSGSTGFNSDIFKLHLKRTCEQICYLLYLGAFNEWTQELELTSSS